MYKNSFNKILEIIKKSDILKKKQKSGDDSKQFLDNIISFKIDEEVLSYLKKNIDNSDFKKELLNSYSLLLKKIEEKKFKIENVYINNYLYETIELYDKALLRYFFLIMSTHEMSFIYLSKILANIKSKEKLKDILEIIVETDFKVINNINYFESIYLNSIKKWVELATASEFKNILNEFLFFFISSFFSNNSMIRDAVFSKYNSYIDDFNKAIFNAITKKIITILEEFKIKNSFKSLLELCNYDVIIFSETDQFLRDWIVKTNEEIKSNENEEEQKDFLKFICDELDKFLALSYKKYSHKINNNFENILKLSKSIFNQEDEKQSEINTLFNNTDIFLQNILKKIFDLILKYNSKEDFFINLNFNITSEKILKLLIETDSISQLNDDKDCLKPLEDYTDVYNPDEDINILDKENEKQNLSIKTEKDIINNNESKEYNKEKQKNKIENREEDSLYNIVLNILTELKDNFNFNQEEDIKKIKQFIEDIILDKKEELKNSTIEKAIQDSLKEEDFESL